jgi:hypothetical protein
MYPVDERNFKAVHLPSNWKNSQQIGYEEHSSTIYTGKLQLMMPLSQDRSDSGCTAPIRRPVRTHFCTASFPIPKI